MTNFKPSDGYATIEEEFEHRIGKAFIAGKADFIIIDSRRQQFQIAMTAFGQEKGWLGPCEELESEQWAEWRFRLTPEGRKHFEANWTSDLPSVQAERVRRIDRSVLESQG